MEEKVQRTKATKKFYGTAILTEKRKRLEVEKLKFDLQLHSFHFQDFFLITPFLWVFIEKKKKKNH